jgi:hypothetical protein
LSSVPLTQAVTSGDAGAVSVVLANGADVNERTGGGQTPLILATIFGHTHLIPLLLDAGADPQMRDNLGLNAIDWAQRRGATEAIGVLTGKPGRTSPARIQTSEPTRPVRPSRAPKVEEEKPKSISEEERSRRWLAGLKQRIAEQSHAEIPDGPNIFRPQSASTTPSQPEIPRDPAPQPEIPAQPEPQPEIPAPSPDPQPEIPSPPPEPEVPTQPPITEPEPQAKTAVVKTEAETPRRSSTRKRCPQCNAIYNSELLFYCAHHVVPLVDADELPIISEPRKGTPVMFWVIIVITLTGSLVIGTLITAYFYNPGTTQQAASSPSAPVAVQKGTPALDEALEGKAVSLPIAECPLNGQEAIPGTVVVDVIIDRSGQVIEAQASGGDWLLRGAASEAALKSTFAPEKLRGRETEGTITYTFEP